MRVLTLMNSAWDMRSGICATFEDFLSEIPDIEGACIECGCGRPESGVIKRHFQISELTLINNLKNKRNPSGFIADGENASVRNEGQKRRFDLARRVRLQAFLWARDMIWKTGRWDTKELSDFITSFSPDVFFAPVFSLNYLCDVTRRVSEIAGCPLALYIGDDVYTNKKLSFSPLFWLDHLLFKRRKIRALVKKASLIYVASEAQKAEYEKIFKKECKVVIRRSDFSGEPVLKEPGTPLELVYAGNVYADRYRTIGAISRALERLSREKGAQTAHMTVYTGTPLSARMRRVMMGECTTLGGAVSRERVTEAERDADILVCAESLRRKGALLVRHSVSTKTTDLLGCGRCILAVGREGVAQLDFFERDGAAVTAHTEEEIYERLKELSEKKEMLAVYAKRAHECGRKRCDSSEKSVFRQDFKEVSAR